MSFEHRPSGKNYENNQGKEVIPDEKFESRKHAILENFKKEFLVNAIPEKYSEIIQGAAFIMIKEPYFQGLLSEIETSSDLGNSEFEKIIKEKIKGGIVVDLGCGNAKTASNFVSEMQAKQFIGIDLFPSFSDQKEKVDTRLDSVKERKNNRVKLKIECFNNTIILSGDMLETVSQFPDKSVSVFLACGIEFSESQGRTNDEYLQALNVELSRVLKNGGILVTFGSDIDIYYPNVIKIMETKDQFLKIFEKNKIID